MKFFMDTESRLVIPHVIEEVPDFKKFWRGTCALGAMHWRGTQMLSNLSFIEMAMAGH